MKYVISLHATVGGNEDSLYLAATILKELTDVLKRKGVSEIGLGITEQPESEASNEQG